MRRISKLALGVLAGAGLTVVVSVASADWMGQGRLYGYEITAFVTPEAYGYETVAYDASHAGLLYGYEHSAKPVFAAAELGLTYGYETIAYDASHAGLLYGYEDTAKTFVAARLASAR